MDSFHIYGFALLGMFAAFFLISLSIRLYLGLKPLMRKLYRVARFYALRHLILRQLIRRHSLIGPVSWLNFLSHVIYWVGTGTCNIWGLPNRRIIGLRAGKLALLNFGPLLFSSNLGVAADLLGLSLKSFKQLHRSLAVMTTVQSSLHLGIALADEKFSAKNRKQLYGLLAAVAIAALTIFPLFRRYLYEIFVKSHVLLSIFATYVIWRHLGGKHRIESFYLLLSIGLFAASLILQFLLLIYRNVARGGQKATAVIHHHAGAISVKIIPARTWKVRAGQYVQLCLPRLGWLSVVQTHPFMIAWWEEDGDERAISIEVLVKVGRGFTGAVSRRCPDSARVPILLGGPYGRSMDVSDYEAVLLIASDIGIAAQISHAKQALSRSSRSGAKPRAILLAWELRRNDEYEWVGRWMNKLLDLDFNYKLNIHVYNCSDTAKGRESIDLSEHNRLSITYTDIDLDSLLSKLQQEKGQKIVAVSARGSIRQKTMDLVRNKADRDLDYAELDFQPDEKL